jgi:hypothetical protein
MISESIKDQPGFFQLYHYWVYNRLAELACSYIVSGSTMDWPRSYPAISLVVKCTGNPQVLLDVPGPVPAERVRVFAQVHTGEPWVYPDPYLQVHTCGFCGPSWPPYNLTNTTHTSIDVWCVFMRWSWWHWRPWWQSMTNPKNSQVSSILRSLNGFTV